VFVQTTKDLALTLFRSVVGKYKKSCTRAMQILEEGIEDALVFMAFPELHRRKIASTNPIEHLNREIRRRTRSVGIFPSRESAIRLISMILLEQTEDWQAEKAYVNPESLAALYASADDDS
jgi:putative transposase